MVLDLYFLDLSRAGATVGPYFTQRYTTHVVNDDERGGAGRARISDKQQRMTSISLLGGPHHCGGHLTDLYSDFLNRGRIFEIPSNTSLSASIRLILTRKICGWFKLA